MTAETIDLDAEQMQNVQWVEAALHHSREGGRVHATLGLVDEKYVSFAADVAFRHGWHIVTVWSSGNRTMVLFRLVAP